MSGNPSKVKISLLYPYFKPGYKAGGITQSLYNLCIILAVDYDIQVVCFNHDLHEKELYPFIKDNITIVEESYASIVYIDSRTSHTSISKIVKAFNPAYVYISSMYDVKFFLTGFWNCIFNNSKLVIAPRGMLHSGGLQKGTLKKKIYLLGLKCLLAPVGKVKWHATDQQELSDIKTWFGKNVSPFLAHDTPRPLPVIENYPSKKKDELKLVYYSLITGKKNLDLLLKSLQNINLPVSLDIYGPTVEEHYWNTCKTLIAKLPSNIKVTYHGQVSFEAFAKEAYKYQFMILPSKGENFGHVIYEALSLSLPVVISKFTPWVFNDKEQSYYIDLNDKAINNVLTELFNLGEPEYDNLSKSARLYVEEYYKEKALLYRKEYGALFAN